MSHLPSARLPFQSAKAVRIALASAAISSIVAIAACSDATNQKSITAPPQTRSATTSSGQLGHGNGFAGKILVCVDASSPAGTYQFSNSLWNDNHPIGGGPVDQGDGGDGFYPYNGTTVWNPARGNSAPYTVGVGPGGCVLVADRTEPSLHYNGVDPIWNYGPDELDDFQSVRISIASVPIGAQYDHTDCVGDIGIPDPQPSPCGNTNQTTKAFANYDHGTQVTYVFTQATTSTGLIAPTATTCADYRNGNASAEPGIFVGLKSGKINNAAPGVFFYYAHVNTTGMGTKTIGFTQAISSSAGLNYLYAVQQGQAYLYNQSCSVVATLPANGAGVSMPAGNYILGIKFSTDAAKGTTPSSLPSPLATHSYASTIGGVSQATTAASIATSLK